MAYPKTFSKKLISYGKIAVLATAALLFVACSDDEPDEEVDNDYDLQGTIYSSVDSLPLANTEVRIINEETQQDAMAPVLTAADGTFDVDVLPGIYQIRVSAQGYNPNPPAGVPATPIVVSSDTTIQNIYLLPSEVANASQLKGFISGYSNSVGALVTLTLSEKEYTSVSSTTGNYTLYNIPAGTYIRTVQTKGYANYKDTVTLVADAILTDTLSLTSIEGNTVSGAITFLATSNIEVDVSLTDSVTGVVIPGLNTMTSGGKYTISSVPDGKYLARATYTIDGVVVDPDWILKFGEPMVTVAGADVTRDFSVTGAVALTSPVTEVSGIMDTVTSVTPTLTWSAYSSSSEYSVELFNDKGLRLWGGFDNDDTLKNVIVASDTLSLTYGAIAAGEDLESGHTYRWRVYARKDDKQEPSGWRLISASEEAQGAFHVLVEEPAN